ncbi:mercury resistance system transport protein MerF [Sulfitobacter sp. MF3-043]|uniref:mercury resistance system transport protein MerF n=1 Tax=Sulfitobacter sediminivivens TaxID=3252902 RepID=UPI0036D97937
MTNGSLLCTGLIGSIVMAMCCFTPVLVVLFAAIGLSSVVGYLDIVLLPALIIFLVILVIAVFRGIRGHG